MSMIPASWAVPGQIATRFGRTVGRQRAMMADGHLVLALHAPPARSHARRDGRLFWRDPTGQWKSTSHGEGPHALEQHLNEYADRIERLEKSVESSRTAQDYYRQLQLIAPLHRSLHNLHAALQQAREMLPNDPQLITFRDQANDLERALELLHSDAELGLNYTIAHLAEMQSQHMFRMAVAAHRLNLLAAVFLPLACFSSLFGMNVPNGLEDTPVPWVFLAVMFFSLFTGAVLTVYVLKRPEPPLNGAGSNPLNGDSSSAASHALPRKAPRHSSRHDGDPH